MRAIFCKRSIISIVLYLFPLILNHGSVYVNASHCSSAKSLKHIPGNSLDDVKFIWHNKGSHKRGEYRVWLETENERALKNRDTTYGEDNPNTVWEDEISLSKTSYKRSENFTYFACVNYTFYIQKHCIISDIKKNFSSSKDFEESSSSTFKKSSSSKVKTFSSSKFKNFSSSESVNFSSSESLTSSLRYEPFTLEESEFDWEVNNFSVQQNNKEIILTWSPPQYHDECYQRYHIQVKDNEGQVVRDIDVPRKKFKHRISMNEGVEMKPCNEYLFTLTVKGSRSSLKDSYRIRLTTSASVPGQVQTFKITDIKSTEVRLSWSKPNVNAECLTYYNLSWYSFPEDSLMESELIDDVDVHNFTITKLTPSKKYGFAIKCHGIAGSSHSQNLTAITNEHDHEESSYNSIYNCNTTYPISMLNMLRFMSFCIINRSR